MSVQRLLVIDQTVIDYQAIASAARTDVRVVIFDPKEDTYSSLLQKIGEGSFESVGFVQHGSYTAPEYRLLEKEASAKVLGVELYDAQLATWDGFRTFINTLKAQNSISIVDLISCQLYSNPAWVYIIAELEKQTGIDFRASSDPTGNLANGGNWIQESDSVNIEGIYFTEAIQEYKGVLVSYTNASFYNSNKVIRDKDGNQIYMHLDINGRPIYPPVNSDNSDILFPEGKLVVWGASGSGGTAPASVTDPNNASYVPIVAVYASQGSSSSTAFAALRKDGTVIGWGTNAPASQSDKNNANFSPAIKVVTSYYSFAVLRQNGTVVAWGDNSTGGTTAPTSVTAAGSSVADIYASPVGFVAIKTNGSIQAWGGYTDVGSATIWPNGGEDILKNPSNANFSPAVFMASSRYQAAYAVLRQNGTVIAFGFDSYGSTAPSSVRLTTDPNYVPVVSVYATQNAFHAVRTDGTVVSWGDSQTANPPTIVTNKNAVGFVPVSKIYTNDWAALALRTDGSVVGWGNSGYYGGSIPTKIANAANAGFSRVVSITMSPTSYSALCADGTISGASVPAGNPTGIVQITGGVSGSWAALKSDGTVIGWGSSTPPSSVTAAGSSVTFLFTNSSAMGALKTDGSIVCWGTAANGGTTPTPNTGIIAVYSTDNAFAAIIPTVSTPVSDYYLSTGAYKRLKTRPDAPTISSVVRGNGSLTVNFSAPASDGYATITKYTITYGGSTVDITNLALTSYQITGLTNGTSYPVSMTATNSVGASVASNQISQTPATTPSAPTITSITVGDTELTVNYSAPASNGGNAITKYILSYGATSIDITNLSLTSYQLTGLTNGTTYTFTMKAVNDLGESAQSASQSAVPATSQRAPVLSGSHAFSTINASSAGGSVFSISSIAAALTIEDVNSETPQQSIGFAVTSADNTLGTWYYSVNNQVTWVAMSSVSSSNAVHLGRTGNEFLKFVPTSAESVGSTSIVVRAWDATNSGQLVANVGDASSVGGITAYSSDAVTISATIITGPSAPRNFSAAVSTTTLNFSWLAPSRIGALSITNYQIVNMDTDAVVLETNTLSGSLSNLTPYTIYRYAIRAINNEGIVSELSSTITAMPLQATNTVNTSSITQSISTLLQSGGSGGTAAVASVLESTSQNTEAVRNILESVINTQTSISTISVAEATTVFSSITTLVSNITNTSTQKLVVEQASRAIFEGTLAQVAVTASSSTETVTAVKDAFLTTFSTLKTTGGVSSFATEGLKAAAQALLSDPGIPEETALTAALFTSYSDTTSKAAIFDALIQEKPAQSFTLSSALTTQLIANIPEENKTEEFKNLTSLDLLVPTQTNLVNLTDIDLTDGKAALITFKPDVTYKVTYNGANVLIKYISSENKLYRNNIFVPLGENVRVGDSFFKLLQVGTGTWTNNTPGWNYNNPDAIPCIVKGQRILTPDGEVPVETLKDGDLIRTPDGRDVPVKVYPFTVEKATAKTAPVYIPKDVFGTNYPPREIVLSGYHAIMKSKEMWELPIHAMERYKRKIVQKGIGAKAEYFHVETPNYFTDLLVVEGSVIEGYGANFMKAIGMPHEKIYKYNTQRRGYHRVIPNTYKKSEVRGLNM